MTSHENYVPFKPGKLPATVPFQWEKVVLVRDTQSRPKACHAISEVLKTLRVHEKPAYMAMRISGMVPEADGTRVRIEVGFRVDLKDFEAQRVIQAIENALPDEVTVPE